MKKVLCISGVLTVLLLALLLSGWAVADDTVKESLRQGNQRYESDDYNEALSLYETGLEASPENKALSFNAAQAAYLLGEYEKSIGYYEKSGDSTDKFLNAGNICYRVGDIVEEAEQKAQYYSQALQIYLEGIAKYPQNIPLKYNYELVKEKLEELLQNEEQESDGEGEDGESQEGQEGQEQESTENSQGDQSQESEDSQGDQEQESENEEESQESQEQASEQDDNSEEEQSQAQESQEGDGEQQETEALDQEVIERILQMLEAQESESLKNNQEVVGGNEGKNGW